jgi:hypothetical protein
MPHTSRKEIKQHSSCKPLNNRYKKHYYETGNITPPNVAIAVQATLPKLKKAAWFIAHGMAQSFLVVRRAREMIVNEQFAPR